MTIADHFTKLNENIPTVISLNIQRSVEGFLETLEKVRGPDQSALAAFTSLPTFLCEPYFAGIHVFYRPDKDLLGKRC